VAKLSLGRSALLDAAFERATLYRARLKRLKEFNQPGYSYWYECNSRHFTLALTPLTVADKFKEVMAQKPGSWIFTSATLSVNDDLHHFTERLGITEAKSLLLPSPFDYATQALLCVPRNLPLPNQPGAARHPLQGAAARTLVAIAQDRLARGGAGQVGGGGGFQVLADALQALPGEFVARVGLAPLRTGGLRGGVGRIPGAHHPLRRLPDDVRVHPFGVGGAHPYSTA